jgi:hypothetical protein
VLGHERLEGSLVSGSQTREEGRVVVHRIVNLPLRWRTGYDLRACNGRRFSETTQR